MREGLWKLTGRGNRLIILHTEVKLDRLKEQIWYFKSKIVTDGYHDGGPSNAIIFNQIHL